MDLRLGCLIALLALVGCPPVHDAKEPEPDRGSGGFGPIVRAGCPEACAHGAELGCSWSKPTARGASCVEVCENVQASATVAWNCDCMVRAESCAKADRCVQ